MNIAALIGVLIAVVVGVSLIVPAIDTIGNATQPGVDPVTGAATEPAVSGAAGSLMIVLPIIFVALIILGAIVWMGFLGGEKTASGNIKTASGNIFKNPRDLYDRIGKASERYEPYLNNLDDLLGIRTRKALPLTSGSIDGLELNHNDKKETLLISNSYDWFITGKDSNLDIFHIVGLNKKERAKNTNYLLGKDGNNKPFLAQLPVSHLGSTCEQCKGWYPPDKEKMIEVERVAVPVATPTRGIGATYAHRDAYPFGE